MTKEELVKEYLRLATHKKNYPSLEDMENAGITRAMIRVHYTSLQQLKEDIVNSGELADIILDIETLGSSYIKDCLKRMRKYKRFVITSAVTNSKVNKDYLDNIKTYCKYEDACLIIIPSIMKAGGAKYTIDPVLKDELIVFYDLSLNDNIKILGIANNAKTTEPTTGLPRLGKRNGSIIVGSPKQNLKIVPTGINKLPHALMSTGAITNPQYSRTSILKSKTDVLADNDHVLGALIVELDDNDMFHFRQTQSDSTNRFTDLGYYYKDGKKIKVAPAGLVLGDLHSGEICEETLSGIFKLTDAIDIPEYIIHDGVSLNSVSHHLVGKNVTLAKMAQGGRLSLEEELMEYSEDLKRLKDHVDRVTIVASNHDAFLTTFLQEGRYVTQPHNHKLALLLASAMLEDKNPLEYFAHSLHKVPKKGFTWLNEDESYYLADVLVSMHGHRGPNGKRGLSPKGGQEAFGNCITGHSHTPAIVGTSMVVGTTSKLQLDYNKGASSWLNTSAIVYNNGVKQLINFFNGEYTTRKL